MAELQIPITKAKGEFITIDTDKIPTDVYAEMLLQGAKVLLNRGTSKITKAAYPDAAELKAKAIEKAQEQLALVMESKIKFTGQKKASGATGAVKTEAMRLAKALVKDELKRQGFKISHIEASEITKVAKEYLDASPELLEQAKANIEARQQIKVGDKLNVKSLVKENPKLVAKAEAKKAGTLSATQAGKVKTRARPQANA